MSCCCRSASNRADIFLLAVALAMAWVLAGCPKPAGEPVTLKVMSYNLRHNVDWWEQRFPLIADEIVRLRPDLIGLQEVQVAIGQESTLDDLIRARDASLDYHIYRELKSGVDAATGEGIAIFSLQPQGQVGKQDLSEGRVAIRARIEVAPGLAVDFFTTHLDASGDDVYRWPQVQDVVRFVDLNDEGQLALLTGDFNSTDDTRVIQHVVDSGFVDSFKELHGAATAELGATSPIVLRQQPGEQNPTRRIDFVFARAARLAKLEALASVVVGNNPDAQGLYPSDHLGVLTTLRATPATE